MTRPSTASSASEILQKREAEAKVSAPSDGATASNKAGGGSRSASPGTTFLNSIIRSAVPVAARVLESALKNYTRKR